ncbi:hypothetical protein IDJ77_25065 [Mucilaginibacter sp. ZT4R22]|uniref:Alpha-L-rhamnosidase six-hairpin glycosidase domain-containing protein n=1 Tax=Mucilaginibacter pankratovii TaxID=2772110 RepID=A0ABR7WXT6_9SPHI|nr:hypothetical protein [Mucilaginibacter pankratovii]MBD1367106.1 hypothetical protein [Mucilaginibacter pankratovii]
MNAISPWANAVKTLFHEQDLPAIFQQEISGYNVRVHNLNNALWIAITCPKGAQVILRPAYAPNDHLQMGRVVKNEDGITINLSAGIGHYRVKLQLPDEAKPLIRYTTTITANEPLLVPFWPRDVVVTGPDESGTDPKGTIYVNQVGTRSGLQYFSIDEPASGAALYFQNLTALNDYAQATETSLGNVVGGSWPEMGFALPPTLKEKPIPAHKEIVLSDGFIAFSRENPKDDMAQAKQFLNLLADIYLHLPKPATEYYDWPGMVDQGLHDLEFSHGCWSHAAEQDYLNAYVADYATPPELMVQLAVLLPLTDYYDWSQKDLPSIQKIKNGLDAFYSEELKTVVRFLPALADELSGEEEQLKPNVMDSWYLHHPMLNLGRLAIRGDKQAKKLFLDSLGFTIKVAHHFNYEWPVMYNMKTLEVVKEETQPGKGGEKDVAGLYALVMLHAWQLTKDDKYLREAKKAAKTLQGKGFELFYQANNTAFSANAMFWLYKETKEKVYLDLTYLCLANIFKNFQLWECNYGYAKDYPTFFAMFPLNDAPYTAAYEEQEVFAAMHNFLLYAEDEEIFPSVSMLVPEFLKYIVNRAPYYYPPNLPKEMLSEEVKTGQVDHKLWIAIEDIHDGWEQSGTVGQEVYGAGVAFGIIPRHFYKVPGEDFMIYLDYPTANFKHRKDGSVSFKVKGDERLSCRMLIIKTGKKKLPAFTVKVGKDELKGKALKDGNVEYTVNGHQELKVIW